jgi:acetoin utilization deacetylase AcuC-like enzyme
VKPRPRYRYNAGRPRRGPGAAFAYHPAYEPAAPPAGFPAGRSAATLAALRELWPAERGGWLEPQPPRPADISDLLLVHDPAYVAAVLEARVPAEIERRIGFAVTPEVAMRARLSVGGTLAATFSAMLSGRGVNLAGGAHHARPDGGAGYCVFNDLAIAARWVLGEVYQRVLVIDLDVHQGDGTAACLADVPGAFTFSIHAEKNYPARKARSDFDIALPDETGDAAYLDALAGGLKAAFACARPQLVLVQAGVDVHRDDRLGRLSLTDAGLVARSEMVRDACLAAGVPLAATMGGGYGDDMAGVGRRHALALMALFEP